MVATILIISRAQRRPSRDRPQSVRASDENSGYFKRQTKQKDQ